MSNDVNPYLLPEATTTERGAMSATDKSKLDNYPTNPSSITGTDAATLGGQLPSYYAVAGTLAAHVGAGGAAHALVTPDPGGTAGFMDPADKAKLDDYPADPNTLGVSPTFVQDVISGSSVQITGGSTYTMNLNIGVGKKVVFLQIGGLSGTSDGDPITSGFFNCNTNASFMQTVFGDDGPGTSWPSAPYVGLPPSGGGLGRGFSDGTDLVGISSISYSGSTLSIVFATPTTRYLRAAVYAVAF